MAQMGTGRWWFLLLVAGVGCESDHESTPRCWNDGGRIEVGTTFSDGCHSCVCGEDEQITCTPTDACVACEHEGEGYRAGESFPAGDGCNLCQCLATGEVSCTDAACGVSCTYGGALHAAGDSFPALDGCNTCSCGTDGVVSCTERACACDPASEWWRHYEASDPVDCQTISYSCPANTTAFQNDCGCGCEQSGDCEESYDCSAGACDPLVIAVDCPYSQIIE